MGVAATRRVSGTLSPAATARRGADAGILAHAAAACAARVVPLVGLSGGGTVRPLCRCFCAASVTVARLPTAQNGGQNGKQGAAYHAAGSRVAPRCARMAHHEAHCVRTGQQYAAPSLSL